MSERESLLHHGPWQCRCTEPAPDGMGSVRIWRPGEHPACRRCGMESSEYAAEIQKAYEEFPWPVGGLPHGEHPNDY